MSDPAMLQVGEIKVEEGMIDDIASEWRCDAERLGDDMRRGGYGYDGGEEKRIDDEAELCKLSITAEVMDDYLSLRDELARVTEERDRLREDGSSLAGIAAAGIIEQSKLTDDLARYRAALEFIRDFEPKPDPMFGPWQQIGQFARRTARNALEPPIVITRISYPESNAWPSGLELNQRIMAEMTPEQRRGFEKSTLASTTPAADAGGGEDA